MKLGGAVGARVRRFGASVLAGCAAIACLVVAAGCGSDGGSSPGPSPVATTRVVTEGSFTLGAPEEDLVYFTTVTASDTATGTWRATVDWTFATNTLWMYVANGACTAEQFAAPECPSEPSCACQFVVRSETAGPKPRVLTVQAAAGGTRTLVIMNLGPREESGTYQITVQSSAALSGDLPLGVSPGVPAIAVSPGTKRVVRR
jgi:hypothetical protein